MPALSTLACPVSHQVVGGCDMWQSWSEGDSISMYYIYDGSYDTSVCLSMSYVTSVCRWMWHVAVMVWGRLYFYVVHIWLWLWHLCLSQHVLRLISISVDVTCGSQGLRETLFLCSTCGYDISVSHSMSHVSSVCQLMWHVTVMVWGRMFYKMSINIFTLRYRYHRRNYLESWTSASVVFRPWNLDKKISQKRGPWRTETLIVRSEGDTLSRGG